MSNPTLRIFSHKGCLAASSDVENGTFINDINDGNQLGVVVDSTNVEITSEALALMKNYKREGGSFAGVMLTKHTDGSSSVSLLGFYTHMLADNEPVEYGRTCDIEVLDKLTVNDDLEIPEQFIAYVNDK